MSRIGKSPIAIPQGVTVTLAHNTVTVKGKLGELTQEINKNITVKVEDGEVTLERSNDQIENRAQHGLFRSLINNMVEGVSKGYEIKQELVGVGYRATNTGQLLELSLGFSHIVLFEIPKEVQIEAVTERRSNPIITLRSADKQLVGQVAAKIRSLRKPEPYKGKGIKFVGEELRKKAGKSAGV